ncbi:MAG: zinc finger domain-containing protein [Actinomycetaceae bacterium]|nr:zinc finger domain-containing protein [Actinomycetaceae bacterium]
MSNKDYLWMKLGVFVPEGHVLHRLARRFNAEMSAEPLVVQSPQGRFREGAEMLDGLELEYARAHGKHLFLKFGLESEEISPWVHIHLGLYGKWQFTSLRDTHDIPEPVGQVRLRLIGDSQCADLRGPNRCALLTFDEVTAVIQRLGPDPLDPQKHDRTVFVDNVRRRRRSMGELVMDQSVVAGPGNIYRAEALFRIGISPFRTGARTSERRLRALWDDLCILMEDGLDTGVITTVRDEDAPEQVIETDPEASRFYVYHRTGRPCLHCETPISEQLMAGRRLFWCPRCQR